MVDWNNSVYSGLSMPLNLFSIANLRSLSTVSPKAQAFDHRREHNMRGITRIGLQVFVSQQAIRITDYDNEEIDSIRYTDITKIDHKHDKGMNDGHKNFLAFNLKVRCGARQPLWPQKRKGKRSAPHQTPADPPPPQIIGAGDSLLKEAALIRPCCYCRVS
jgi:hypothetical protein